MIRRKFTMLILICLFASLAVNRAYSQEFVYKVEFSSLFDNLEGSQDLEPTRSLFSVKLAPEIGLRIDKKHRIMIGADLIQNFGDSSFLSHADYIAYYSFNSDNFNAYTGSFNRNNSIANYPLSFFREDYYFYNPNIEGVMFQYMNNKGNGYAEFFFDWYGLNRKLRIDEFLLVGSTNYDFYDKRLSIGASALLNHFNNPYYLKDCSLLERVQYNIYAATDLKYYLPALDKFRIGVGLMGSMENKRRDDVPSSWQSSMGVQADLCVVYKGFGIENNFYTGKEQFPFHKQYGSEFYPGSPFYQASNYNRTNIFYGWKNKFLCVKAELLFHYTKYGLANQQRISLNIDIEQIFKKKINN